MGIVGTGKGLKCYNIVVRKEPQEKVKFEQTPERQEQAIHRNLGRGNTNTKIQGESLPDIFYLKKTREAT